MTPLVYSLFSLGFFTTICGLGYLLVRGRFALLFFGLCLGLLSIVIFHNNKKGSAVSLDDLEEGKKYEVVAIYEKYIIIKPITNDKELKFIGPLDFGTITIGRYIKTAEESLEKIE